MLVSSVLIGVLALFGGLALAAPAHADDGLISIEQTAPPEERPAGPKETEESALETEVPTPSATPTPSSTPTNDEPPSPAPAPVVPASPVVPHFEPYVPPPVDAFTPPGQQPIEEPSEEPTPSATPTPTQSPTKTNEATPTPSPTPTDSATATPITTVNSTPLEAAAQTVGTSPIVRIAVIALLVGLGIFYYARLRGTDSVPGLAKTKRS